jgi:RNA ligase
MQAEVFVVKNPKYLRFAEYCLDVGITPIFEWCSPQNKVVLDYSEEQLILTGLREIKSGKYVPYADMRESDYQVRVVGTFLMPDHWAVLDEHEGIEGVVVRFDDGHMVKIKTSWYVGIHKALSGLVFEKDVLTAILKGTVDDLLPFLPEQEREQVQKYRKQVESSIVGYTQLCYDAWRHGQEWGRKQFALSNSYPKMAKSVVFDCWEDISDVQETLVNKLLGSFNSQSNVDKVRSVFGVQPWRLRRNYE